MNRQQLRWAVFGGSAGVLVAAVIVDQAVSTGELRPATVVTVTAKNPTSPTIAQPAPSLPAAPTPAQTSVGPNDPATAITAVAAEPGVGSTAPKGVPGGTSAGATSWSAGTPSGATPVAQPPRRPAPSSTRASRENAEHHDYDDRDEGRDDAATHKRDDDTGHDD